MATAPPDWNQRYLTSDTPWDSGIRSRELTRVLEETPISPCRCIELGCGTGTNAVFLASQGFEVTGVDVSPLALEQARALARQEGVSVQFLQVDLLSDALQLPTFDFVFDRGCYHVLRRSNLREFVDAVCRLTHSSSRWLSLSGNANEQDDSGIPRVSEAEVRTELGGPFEIEFIRAMRFQDRGGADGPLGWSVLLRRK